MHFNIDPLDIIRFATTVSGIFREAFAWRRLTKETKVNKPEKEDPPNKTS
jgi:hypothetical protein